MVYTLIPFSLINSFSPSSNERAPIITRFSGLIFGVYPPIFKSTGCLIPRLTANGMPWMLTDGDVSAVFKSAWASYQITPKFSEPFATPASVPIAMLWSPPNINGKRSCSLTSSTLAASCSFPLATAAKFFKFVFLSTSARSLISTLISPSSCTV